MRVSTTQPPLHDVGSFGPTTPFAPPVGDGLHQLRTVLWVPMPRAEVFPFFADAANLDAITPKWLRFHIDSPMPIDMRVGATIDYRLRVRGVPIRWRSRIARWEPPFGFVDEQVRGPYRVWHHQHLFFDKDGGTEIVDHVHYRARGGWLEPLVQRLFVQRDVERIFRHRQQALAAMFGGNAQRSAAISRS